MATQQPARVMSFGTVPRYLAIVFAIVVVIVSCIQLANNVPHDLSGQLSTTRAQLADATRINATAPPSRSKATQARLSEAQKNFDAAQHSLSSSTYFAWFGAAALVVLYLISALLAADWNPFALAMGLDNRLSTSKMQALMWTGCVGFVYTMIYADRMLTTGAASPITGVPENVLIALGMSVTSVVAAKAITSSQVANNPDSKDTKTTPSYDPAALVRGDGETASLTKVQVLFWTVIAIAVYVVTSFHELGTTATCSSTNCTLPDIDTTLMFFMGLGHATYLGGKLTGSSTPLLTSLTAADAPGGKQITLLGANLGTTGQIILDGVVADPQPIVDSWTSSKVVITLPASRLSTAGSRIAIALSVSGVTSPSINYANPANAIVPPRVPHPVTTTTSVTTPRQPVTNHPGLARLNGIDVSDYQTLEIDWDAVKSQNIARFVYARATYAGSRGMANDGTFERNYQECSRLQIPLGAYHFFSFDQPGLAQAQFFIQRVQRFECSLRPVVDVESNGIGTTSPYQILANLNDFVKAVEQALRTPLIIYTNQDTWNEKLAGPSSFSGHTLWVASTTNDPDLKPAMPAGFGDWTLYQYGKGSLPLLGNRDCPVDLDILKGDLSLIQVPATGAGNAFREPPIAHPPAGGSGGSNGSNGSDASNASNGSNVKLARAIFDGINLKLKLYDNAGMLLFQCEARNTTVASNGWRPYAGCPPGSYSLQTPLRNDPTKASTAENDWLGEGLWFIPIVGIPGHSGIGIHGGGTGAGSEALAPLQGWYPTENCIRVQNQDLEKLVRYALDGLSLEVEQPTRVIAA